MNSGRAVCIARLPAVVGSRAPSEKIPIRKNFDATFFRDEVVSALLLSALVELDPKNKPFSGGCFLHIPLRA